MPSDPEGGQTGERQQGECRMWTTGRTLAGSGQQVEWFWAPSSHSTCCPTGLDNRLNRTFDFNHLSRSCAGLWQQGEWEYLYLFSPLQCWLLIWLCGHQGCVPCAETIKTGPSARRVCPICWEPVGNYIRLVGVWWNLNCTFLTKSKNIDKK